MDEQEKTKQTGFRLPQETLNQLDWMIEEGIVRNRTEAVILAVDRFQYQKNISKQWNDLFDILLELLEDNPEDIIIYKALLDDKAKITREVDSDHTEHITIEMSGKVTHMIRDVEEPIPPLKKTWKKP
jgi:Arc/MetJ-type ribon-helix-helix transcriptional regulator